LLKVALNTITLTPDIRNFAVKLLDAQWFSLSCLPSSGFLVPLSHLKSNIKQSIKSVNTEFPKNQQTLENQTNITSKINFLSVVQYYLSLYFQNLSFILDII
jgi:hypothetical protein